MHLLIVVRDDLMENYDQNTSDKGAEKGPTEFELILCTVKPIHDPKVPFCFELVRFLLLLIYIYIYIYLYIRIYVFSTVSFFF